MCVSDNPHIPGHCPSPKMLWTEEKPPLIQWVTIAAECNNGGKLPEYKSLEASGADLYASADAIIEVGRVVLVPTGVKVAIPYGFEGQVRSRSGLAVKNNVFVLNSPGTIDSDYRGEIFAILANLGQERFFVSKGDRVAQLVIAPVVRAMFYSVDKLSVTDRGEGGLGSTGR